MKQDPPALALLRLLASGDTVSGQMLASRLRVTRAAVWKQVAALRTLGLPVEARTRVGYRLPWPVELLDERSMVSALGTDCSAPVHLHWELDSTQDELARLATHARDLTVVLAEHQTRGRGRRGQDWLSPPGLGIWLSCLKRFDGGPAALSGLSVAMGVCVVQALQDLGVSALALKWPNDVMSAHGKLAGILIEVSGEYDGPTVARVGLGLNLRLPPGLLEELDQDVADIAGLCNGEVPGRNTLAAHLIAQIRAGLLRFEQHGLTAFASEFAAMDWLLDQPVNVHDSEGTLAGIARGIDPQGALRVEIDGRIRLIHSQKVSVRART